MGDGGVSIPPWSVLQGAFGPASPRSKQGLGFRMTHVFAPRHGCQYGQAPCCMACMSRSTLFQCHWKPDRASNMIHPKLLKRTSARKKKTNNQLQCWRRSKGRGQGVRTATERASGIFDIVCQSNRHQDADEASGSPTTRQIYPRQTM